ncbi:hypothetical protein QYM36_009881 [Artemia franciscana]|uniref:ASD2 domain-containing protein n=1 Tax=Artemia franciscana TaxID=6661 RepID=A0AA88L152_ARTSF|nr:hypothetical protein QYM36_009881 [Artemia franciscana]
MPIVRQLTTHRVAAPRPPPRMSVAKRPLTCKGDLALNPIYTCSSTFPDIDSPSDGNFGQADAGPKSMQPPERPPKKPHMRPSVQHLQCNQRAAPQQPVGSSNNSFPSPSHTPSPVAKKPPAPEPPSRPDIESRIPPYHGRWEDIPGTNNSTHRHSNELGKVRDILEDDPPPALPARISPTFSEPISASYLKPPAFQGPPPVLPARLSPLGLEHRPMTPDLPPPPPPPIVSSDGALEDEPLPPPPSPLLSKENNKESYSETTGEITSPVISTDNFTSLDSPGAPMSWEKLHNIRSNGTTVVFTSEELAKIKEKHKMVQKLSTESTYRSEIIIYPSNEQVQLEILAKKQNTENLSSHLIVPRSKGLEEIECDKLTVELAKQLPESDKLKTLLGGTDVKTAFDYVEEIFGLGTINVASKNYSYSAKNDIAAMENGEEMSETRSPRRSLSPLAENSVYLISSESKTKLLTQCSDDTEKTNSIPIDTDSLLQKKEDLVKRLDKKLEILRLERQAIHEDMSSNEKLGKEVSSRVAEVATSGERNKVALHVLEVEKITALLLGLAGRLARAQNALASLGENVDSQEKTVLESKRDKLMEQLEEARVLKLSIEKRSRNVSTLLLKYFTQEEYADYEHFVTMKAKLAVDAREIEEKIKLGEEQLMALKETLSGNLGPIL